VEHFNNLLWIIVEISLKGWRTLINLPMMNISKRKNARNERVLPMAECSP